MSENPAAWTEDELRRLLFGIVSAVGSWPQIDRLAAWLRAERERADTLKLLVSAAEGQLSKLYASEVEHLRTNDSGWPRMLKLIEERTRERDEAASRLASAGADVNGRAAAELAVERAGWLSVWRSLQAAGMTHVSGVTGWQQAIVYVEQLKRERDEAVAARDAEAAAREDAYIEKLRYLRSPAPASASSPAAPTQAEMEEATRAIYAVGGSDYLRLRQGFLDGAKWAIGRGGKAPAVEADDGLVVAVSEALGRKEGETLTDAAIRVERERHSLLAAARQAIPEEEHPTSGSIEDWAWQIRNLGGDRRAAYRKIERLQGELDACGRGAIPVLRERDEARREVEKLERALRATEDERTEARDEAKLYRVQVDQLGALVAKLKAEIAVGDGLLADRDRLLDALPCRAHGRCVPHAIERVKALEAAVAPWAELGRLRSRRVETHADGLEIRAIGESAATPLRLNSMVYSQALTAAHDLVYGDHSPSPVVGAAPAPDPAGLGGPAPDLAERVRMLETLTGPCVCGHVGYAHYLRVPGGLACAACSCARFVAKERS